MGFTLFYYRYYRSAGDGSRLGIVARQGLGEALNIQFHSGIGRLLSVILILSAILIGNAAYETGNILGGALGMEALVGVSSVAVLGNITISIWGPVIGVIAFVLLYLGSYKRLKPVPVIVFAQAANGILLPIIAIYLLWVMNDKKLLGEYRNHLLLNILGGLVVLVTIFLGLRSMLSVFGVI